MAARKHMRNYLQTVLKIAEPGYCLLFNSKDNPCWTMMFNISRKDFGSDAEYQSAIGYWLSFLVPSKNGVYR